MNDTSFGYLAENPVDAGFDTSNIVIIGDYSEQGPTPDVDEPIDTSVIGVPEDKGEPGIDLAESEVLLSGSQKFKVEVAPITNDLNPVPEPDPEQTTAPTGTPREAVEPEEAEEPPKPPIQGGEINKKPPRGPDKNVDFGDEADLPDPDITRVSPETLKPLWSGAGRIIDAAGKPVKILQDHENPNMREHQFSDEAVAAAGFFEGTTVTMTDMPEHEAEGFSHSHMLVFRVTHSNELLTSERVLPIKVNNDGDLEPVIPGHNIVPTAQISSAKEVIKPPDRADITLEKKFELIERAQPLVDEWVADMFTQAEADQLQWLIKEESRILGLPQTSEQEGEAGLDVDDPGVDHPEIASDERPTEVGGSEGVAGEVVEAASEEVDYTQDDPDDKSGELSGTDSREDPKPENGPPRPESGQYRVIGPWRDIPGIKEDIPKSLEHRRDTVSFRGESPLTEQEKTLVTKIQEGIVSVADELGVNIRDRLLKVEHHHFFDGHEEYVKSVSETLGPESVGSGGSYRPDSGLLWVRHKDPVLNASGIAHETVHSVSLMRVKPILASSVVIDGVTRNNWGMELSTSYGFTRPDRHPTQSLGLLELVTDMLMDKGLHRSGFTSTVLSYAPIDIIGDAVVKETATAHNLSPAKVEGMLMRGMLNGDMTGIRLVGNTLGPERTGQFVRMAKDLDFDQALELAHRLNLPAAVETIEEYKRKNILRGIFSGGTSVD